jgi:hypothetical protein
MTENRSSRRWRTVLKGQVVFNNQGSVFDCTVRDLSETGAQIHLADVGALPEEFTLEIPSKDLRIQARVMWSRGVKHGIMFVEGSLTWADPTRAAAE